MKFSTLSTLLVASVSVVQADYVCPTMANTADMTTLKFAYTVQELLNRYYSSIPANSTFFSDLPMASTVASNGQTLAVNTAANVAGLATQARLGSQAIQMEINMTGTFTPLTCNYGVPMASNGTMFLKNAFYLEATLCGAFIGFADYFQSPTLNSLSARLAAEHGIHAAAIRAMMQPVGFMANSTSLTPAFTPQTLLLTGMEVGHLGDYIAGCAVTPQAPCGGQVSFGDLLPMLSGQSSNGTMSGSNNGSMTSTPSSTGTAPVSTYTGEAPSGRTTSIAKVSAALLALACFFM